MPSFSNACGEIWGNRIIEKSELIECMALMLGYEIDVCEIQKTNNPYVKESSIQEYRAFFEINKKTLFYVNIFKEDPNICVCVVEKRNIYKKMMEESCTMFSILEKLL
ncbi:hypothetical protein D3C81_772610 [compost metagenome]